MEQRGGARRVGGGAGHLEGAGEREGRSRAHRLASLPPGPVPSAGPPAPRLPPVSPPAETFVGVALDLPVETLFTYRVPEALAGRARLGARVRVRFRGKPMVGLVGELATTCDLKTVLDVEAFPDDESLLPPTCSRLGRWIARYYGCAVGEALSAMIPRGVRTRGKGALRRRVRLARPAAEAVAHADGLPTDDNPQGRLLRVLAKEPEGVLQTDLLRRAKASASPVKTLEKQGWIALSTEEATADPLVAAARAPATPEDAIPPTPNAAQAAAIAAVSASITEGTFRGLPPPGRHRLGEDRGVPARDRGVPGRGQAGGGPGARDRAHAADRAALPRPHRARGGAALRDDRGRPRHGLAGDPRGGGRRRDRAAQRGLRAGAAARARWSSTRSTRRRSSSRTCRATTRATSASCARRRPGRPSCSGAPRPRSRATGTRPRGATPCCRCPTASRTARCRPCTWWTCARTASGGARGCTSGARCSRGWPETLGSGGQAILFLNRRGYSTSVSCPRCGFVLKCPHCDVSLTYHRSDTLSICHTCGFEQRPPQACPDCAFPSLKHHGAGTETVEQELATAFPGRGGRADGLRHDDRPRGVRGRPRPVRARRGARPARHADDREGPPLPRRDARRRRLGRHEPPDARLPRGGADVLAPRAGGRAHGPRRPRRRGDRADAPPRRARRPAGDGARLRRLREGRARRAARRSATPPTGGSCGWSSAAPGPRRSSNGGRRWRSAWRRPGSRASSGWARRHPRSARVQGLHRRHLLVKARVSAGIRQALDVLKAKPGPLDAVEEQFDVDPVGML